MKKYLFVWGWILGLFLAGCGDQHTSLPENNVEITQEGASTCTLKGYENTSLGFSVCQPEGFGSPFYIQDKKFAGKAYSFVQVSVDRLDEMTAVPGNVEWQSTVAVTAGMSYWARCQETSVYRFLKMRVMRIEGNAVTLEYVVSDETEEIPNENLNANSGYGNVSVTGYEMPRLDDRYVYADHYVTVNGAELLNYALEWNPDMRHANWVAFSFDVTTSADVVKRTDAWAVDPELPEDMQTMEEDHKGDGFDKGHLCASEDRVYSKEANEQTFYYSNMSPQLNDFNGGFWAKLEARVQSWGRSVVSGTFDKVYVTKGGTMNDLLKNFTGTKVSGGTPTTDANGFTIHGLACPKYYFMAVLAQKGESFQAIAFLVEHKEGYPRNPSAGELQQFVVSIDELEEKTGIDFFCNLPDAVEQVVEASYDVDEWAW